MELFEGLVLGLLVILFIEVSYVLFFKKGAKIKQGSNKPTLIDTSTLMDGRVLEVAKAGFLQSTLLVPKSVVAELQLLADGGDNDKRARARYGLDVIRELQQMKDLSVQILQDGKAKDGVDEQLLALAKQYQATILTLDFNLNKVAQVEEIEVLNINRLAQSLRMSRLPGERQKIRLVQRGNEADQGVGYLDDGTMVVVEKAKNAIGKEVEVEFTRSLQTQAGKMMFAKNMNTGKSNSASRNVSKKQQPAKKRKLSKEESLIELANR